MSLPEGYAEIEIEDGVNVPVTIEEKVRHDAGDTSVVEGILENRRKVSLGSGASVEEADSILANEIKEV